jgi:hypothetical protein
MTRDHFSKSMHSPYFQTDHFKNESEGRNLEKKVEGWFKKIFKKNKK